MNQKNKTDYSVTFARSLVKNFGRVKAKEILNIMKDKVPKNTDSYTLFTNALKQLDRNPVSKND